jgi:serine/threonine protein phosphatase PrpC
LKNTWNFFGTSVKGLLHEKTGINNQDFWIGKNFKWGTLVAVSDGLGSRTKSDLGSKILCKSVIESAKIYHNNLEISKNRFLNLLHAIWLAKISPERAYDCSATCLFAMCIRDKVFIAQLGDGLIVVCRDNKEPIILSDNKDNSFSNITNGLSSDFNANNWRTCILDEKDCYAIVLCTDGISDDLDLSNEFEFANDLFINFHSKNNRVKNRELKKVIEKWPVKGSNDDKTIACLFNSENYNV